MFNRKITETPDNGHEIRRVLVRIAIHQGTKLIILYAIKRSMMRGLEQKLREQ